MSETILETTFVGGFSLLPSISSKPIKPVILKLSLVAVSVSETLLSLAVFQRIDQDTIIGRSISSKGAFAMHNAQFPLSKVSYSIFFDVKTFFVSKAIDKLPFVTPLIVDDFDTMLSFQVVGKKSMKPSYSCLQVESSSISFIIIHHSFVDVAVLEDDDGAA